MFPFAWNCICKIRHCCYNKINKMINLLFSKTEWVQLPKQLDYVSVLTFGPSLAKYMQIRFDLLQKICINYAYFTIIVTLITQSIADRLFKLKWISFGHLRSLSFQLHKSKYHNYGNNISKLWTYQFHAHNMRRLYFRLWLTFWTK